MRISVHFPPEGDSYECRVFETGAVPRVGDNFWEGIIGFSVSSVSWRTSLSITQGSREPEKEVECLTCHVFLARGLTRAEPR